MYNKGNSYLHAPATTKNHTCIEIGFHTGDVERCTVAPVN